MMSGETKSTAASDRREWLRIDDRLPIEFRRLGGSALAEASAPDGEALASMQEFLNKPTQELLMGTGPNDPQAALIPWILKMDWALSVMLSALARMAPGGLALPRMTDVNISATGMSFPSKEVFVEGDLLGIKLILPPFLPLHTTAEVVRVSDLQDHPSGRYLLAVNFTDLGADDQDRLIRHILQLQAERLRTRHRDGQP